MRALLGVTLLVAPLALSGPPQASHLKTECHTAALDPSSDVDCRKVRISVCNSAAEALGYFGPGRTLFVENCAPRKQASGP